MKIKKTIEKVPGGMMIIPIFLSALINTFFPEAFEIGGFVTAIVKNHNAFIGGFLLCMGAGMTFKSAPKALKTGAAITVSKFVVGVSIGLLSAKFFGANGIFGISTLAIISAMTNTNGGLFAALTAQFGSKEEVGAISIVSINDGPFLTMIALGTAGIATIPFWSLVGVIIPIVIGMILGNLDEEMKVMLTQGGTIMIPLMAFALGSNINFSTVLKAGLPGVLLGLLTVGLGGIINIFVDKATGGTGVAGAACSSTAGNAVGTPAAVAAVDPTLTSAALIATPLVAASMVTTAILTPILTTYIAKRNEKKRAKLNSANSESVAQD